MWTLGPPQRTYAATQAPRARFHSARFCASCNSRSWLIFSGSLSANSGLPGTCEITQRFAASNMPSRRKLIAYAAPMAVFVVLLSLNAALKKIDNRFWLASAEYWMYPLQTILCGGLLIWFRREYDFQRLRKIAFTILVGALVFVLWISPQQFLGFPARNAGFNPNVFAVCVALTFAKIV